MLEIGWSEILVIALILIIVVGPKDLPGMLRTFGRMATRLRSMANEFKGQFDEALREAELDDVRKGLDEVNKLNPTNTLRDAINPLRQLGQDIKSDLQKASDSVNASVSDVKKAEEGDANVGETIAPAVQEAEPVQGAVAAAPAASVSQPAVQAAVATQPVAADTAATPTRSKPAAAKVKAVKAADVTDVKAAKPAVRKAAPKKKPVAADVPVVAAEVAPKKKAAPRKKTVKADEA
ncbi:twin-arginine translocase subunit TatB [Rhizobium sp. KVB221]|uniref:Sec-independent protein translocase protein TatB n=1 Tax=Rhizobium setariae TaxID=2801340 RepID=A0A937CPG5_9HYPH|nr:Sec-independent protein translocase protein TatB [Rhizobium setariae]MBL0374886.1 twin-arginine translocase subunit TatB [Rhizobium setariae]